MKIAVFYQHYYPEPFNLHYICEELVKRNHSVDVYTGLPNYPHGNIPKEYKFFKNRKQYINGVNVYRTFEIGRKKGKLGLAINYISYTVSSMFKALVCKKDYDVIYTYSTSPILMNWPALLLKRRNKKRVLIYVLDIWPACLSAMNVKETSLLYKIMRKFSKHIYKNCDKILYSSKAFKSYMKDVHSINLQDEDYLPQFANKVFENHLNDEISLGENGLFVFAGNIGNMQAVDNIIRAAKLCKQEAKFLILGDGSKYEYCKRLIEELNLHDRVTMLGRQDVSKMPEYYKRADAMLVSMKDDILVNYTLPAKVQSYMALAKPIIASINGEAQELIKSIECGLCAKADCPESLAKIIDKYILLSNEQKLAMAQKARMYYIQHFTMKEHIDMLEKQLMELCK